MKRIIILSAVALTLFSCGNGGGNKSVDDLIKSKDTKQMEARRTELKADLAKLEDALSSGKKETEILVSVAPVKDTIFNHFLEVQGSVDTKDNIVIYPQFSGTLQTLTVKAGDHVSKGQVLGKIDDGGLSQQVAQLETQLALAKTTYERQKRLWDQKIGSEIQFLQAQTTMVSQQKAVSQIKAQLAKTVVTAPFTGVIDEVLTERGEVVAPGQGLMRIVNLSNMYVSAEVPEAYIGKVKVGTPVDVGLGSLNKNYVGKVRQVANNINPANRSFSIEVAVPNTDNLLRPNQVSQLKIIDYTNKKALTVPTNVIQQDAEGKKFVYVADQINGKKATAKKAMIKTGQSANNMTEILSGLSDKDMIVTEGANTISEGMKLNF